MSQFEQCNFFGKLRKSAAEMVLSLQEVYNDKALQKVLVFLV